METVTYIGRQMKKYLSELNLFADVSSRSDSFHVRIGIISTRIYIFLLTMSITILVIYTSSTTQLQVKTIKNLSERDFIELSDKNDSSLLCSCSHITIPYGSFTSTTVHYHPVCSSVFVSTDWIGALFTSKSSRMLQIDFRTVASNYFQLLSTLCSQANRSVEYALDDFHFETLLTPSVISPSSLETQVAEKSKFLEALTVNSFRQLLQLVRNTTEANLLQSAFTLSTLMFRNDRFNKYSLMQRYVYFLKKDNSECICYSQQNCGLPTAFFDINTNIIATQFIMEGQPPPLVNVSGFFTGCSMIDSLLSSTLECLFDQSCLDNIHKFIPSSNIPDVYTLNENQTEFNQNMLVESIIDKLFIKTWLIKENFSNYYLHCAPIQCTRELVQRNNALYVFTKLLGFYGGLTAALRLFIPLIVGWWRKRRGIHLSEPRPTNSVMQRLQIFYQNIRIKIIELNLFKNSRTQTDPFERTTSKISTWIYLILLCLSIIIIVIFTWLSTRIESKTFDNPSLANFTKLQTNYSTSLQCPCSNISISYKSFISVSPEFHPVCESLLISDEWIHAMNSPPLYHSTNLSDDVFIDGSRFFISLKSFCKLTKTVVFDSLFIFNQSLLITDQALSDNEFMARANQIFEQFKLNTIDKFKLNLALIHSHTITMYTVKYSSNSWILPPGRNKTYSSYFQAVPIQINNCSCALNDKCKQQLSLYNYTADAIHIWGPPLILLFKIPNMYSGCFPIQSLLQSSLECFFDEKCLNSLIEKINLFPMPHFIFNITMQQSILHINSTRFPPQMLLEQIVDELMVESWNETITYNEYYQNCAIQSCTYYIESGNDIFYVITTTIGLFGGLSVGLRIIVSLIVIWIRNKIRQRYDINNVTVSPTFRERLYTLYIWIKKNIHELNLFETQASWNNEVRRRYEILTTRIYLVCLLISIMILIVYTSITIQTHSYTVKNLTKSKFEKLVSNPKYSSKLDCPCQNLSIKYESFISISFDYHQICSSDFVRKNSSWINLVESILDPDDYSYDDYRRFIVPHFRLLSHLCILSNKTLVDGLSIYYSNTLISKKAQSLQNIEIQMKESLDQFLLLISRNFVRSLDFIQQMAKEYGLVTSISSNWYVPPLPDGENSGLFIPRSYRDNNCSCTIHPMCVSKAMIDKWPVPGFLIGCYPLQSLLQSTLECLYNIQCINKLKKSNYTSDIIIHPLNSTLSSPKLTVQSLVNKLMIDSDRWNPNINYENYYALCAPISCNYIVSEQANPIYIITSIIGLYGGLTVVLGVIVPIFVKIVRYIFTYRQQRIHPEVNVIS